MFFRGQSEEFDFIIPSIYRDINYIKNENNMIKEAEISYPLEIGKAKSQIDKLALMQHYGLPTRILDITTNALVALYFAVSGSNDKDGIVYLFNRKKREKILNSRNTSVIVKIALSKLSFDEKLELHCILEKKNKKNRNLLEETKKLDVFKKLYNNIKADFGFLPNDIECSDFYGLNFVYPQEIDERIIKQSAMFMIFGLDGFCDFDEKVSKFIKNNDEINKKIKSFEELKKYYEGQKAEILGLDYNYSEEEIDNKKEELNQIKKDIGKIEKEKQNREKELKKYIIEKEIKSAIDKLINECMIMYSPGHLPNEEEKWIFNDAQGKAVIVLKAKYKQRIKNELELIGITRKSIYPDIQNKSQYIREKYL
ncbi:FRG domain-containing protein [Fusobacterium nucleatum]